jgi:ribosomal protein L24E
MQRRLNLIHRLDLAQASAMFPALDAMLTIWCDGQGKLYVRGDSKVFRFQNGKSESLFLQRKNPRRIAWTVLFRRQHRKGISEVR